MNENYCLEALIQHHLCVGKRLSAGATDSLLYKPGLFFVYIIVSDCIRKFCIPNGFFNGLLTIMIGANNICNMEVNCAEFCFWTLNDIK